jgi:hypothetical protein
MGQRSKLLLFYIFSSLTLPVLAFLIWEQGTVSWWMIAAVGFPSIAKLVWAWRQQKRTDAKAAEHELSN